MSCPFQQSLTGRLTGKDPKAEQMEQFEVDMKGTQATTNFGCKVDDQHTLRAGLRGPSLMEDFVMREKVMHFDHERIPERVVHARGVGAHGYFETYEDWSDLTAAKFLRTTGKKTPVFVRFSTVLGSRGSPDTVRDVRGFATRFYTEEGNFDLVGNVIAPFFVHDAIKFPDIIHAGKPEPDTETPQAGTAHDTFYDFVSMFPECLHTALWALSGRGVVKSFRQVEGFGVHTFRLINEQGKSVFVKFIWKPLQGLSNLIWDEAQKISGQDIDFHRKDLQIAIDRGDYPEWELCVQIIQEEDEHNFDFDLLDPTKIIPESIVPVKRLGKMTLNRNVKNFFAETEQVTFCVGHIVPGIGFTNDPLLQGRLFSYFDTQLNRMNGANYLQLPINQPICPVTNNYRDGYMQSMVHKGPVSYYPNGLQNNAPDVVPPEKGGYIQPNEKVDGRKVRGQVSSVEDCYSQPQLFWNSLTAAEKQQVVDAARFEIGKVKSKEVRQRMIDVFNRIDNGLARRVAYGIAVPLPDKVVDNPGKTSVGLSIEEYPKPPHIKTKTVAILTAPGIDTADAETMFNFLEKEGAYVEYVGMCLGEVQGLPITNTYTTTSSPLWDAVYVPAGKKGIEKLMDTTSAFPYEEPAVFLLDAFRHGKPIAAASDAVELLKAAKVKMPEGNGEKDGVVIGSKASAITSDFKKAIMQQRFWSRLPLDPEI
ncbi:catalase-like domain-containing protein [Radiomyces spectabilis]|uniref:catalase-like domain-containing protein n=1 Tax=Radiomyces spectabilis TaxID=64574 RepID=UPI00221FB5D9|nr:catalase-like domain-containing protein [Radiomyces spectabilis]KAI8367504.1 catalase-like domain-containing protein [Radiomyces spectabilis]